jgi:hypothetical protein
VGLGDALRRLDDRVLPAPKPVSVTTHRNTFLVGLIGTLLVLVGLILSGRWTAVGAVGGFVGVMIGGGIRWYRAAQRTQR